jgi:hypothetical protein
MGSTGRMSGDRSVTFWVQDPKHGRVQLMLLLKGRDVVLRALSGPDQGKEAVIADCAHLVS